MIVKLPLTSRSMWNTTVSYVYHAMYAYFDRDNVALKGLAKFFKDSSVEEREHAELLMEYQNKRGGKVKLQSILMPLSEFNHPEKGDALYGQVLCGLETRNIERLEDLETVTISGYEDVPENDEQSLLKALSHQPLSVAIEASGRDFQFYSGGVFNGHCGTKLDHGVTAVGYGSFKGLDYIIVKNSWGLKWGEKGYIRMKRNTGKSEGLCGINKMASYPTKKN